MGLSVSDLMVSTREFYLAQLGACQWAEVLAVMNSLTQAQRTFVATKSPEEIRSNLAAPHHAVGAFSNTGQLIGTAFLLQSPPDIITTDLVDLEKHETWPDKGLASGVIATVMVHPDASGKKLMLRMLAKLQEEAIERGLEHLIASVVEGNTASAVNFIAAGFGLVGSAFKPKDRLSRTFYGKKILPAGQRRGYEAAL